MPHRSTALRWISGALNRGDHLVLTSRPAEYVEAVEAGDVVSGAAVIELHDLTSDDLARYLPMTAPIIGKYASQSKWDPVLEHLRHSRAAGVSAPVEVLTTPLMASLARAIYSETAADPAELLDAERFPNAGVVTDHLLDKFVQVKYDDLPRDRHAPQRPQWRPDDARRWLGFLAIMMSAQGTHEFAWWRPGPWRMMRLFNLPVFGSMVLSGVLSVSVAYAWRLLLPTENRATFLDAARLILIIGTWAFFAMTLAIWFGTYANPRELSKPSSWVASQRQPGMALRRAWSLQPIREVVYFCAAITAPAAILNLSVPNRILTPPLATGPTESPIFYIIYVGMTLAFCLTFVGFLSVVAPSKIEARNPSVVLHRDRRAAIATGLYYGALISALCDTTWAYAGHPVWLVTTPVIFAFSVIIAVFLSAYGSWLIRRSGFALVRWLPRPWRCMNFLEDACARGVLRQSGGVYEFRHALLQERLATDFLECQATWVQEHRTVLYARSKLVVSWLDSGSDPEAIEHELRELIEKHRRSKNRHGVLWTWDMLIYALRKTGYQDDALDEAVSFQRYVEDIGTRKVGRYWQYRSRRNLAELLADLGHLGEAVSEHAEALRLAENYWGQDDEDVVEVRCVMVEVRNQLTNRPTNSH